MSHRKNPIPTPVSSSYQEAQGFAEIVASRTRMPRRFLNDRRETQTRSRSNT